MHLKKIEIQGFKSFADKIEIEFKNGITSVVGPNGSGKSNISDAIRWVLGEQSVKTLRGSRMEDIIFSGTDKRKALSFTEVTITLDNNSGKIPIDYKEIAIRRRMFRSGESEYYINKSICRLKDIRELLMNTGIGVDGYSIIGQGKIDEVLSTRPEDRRNIFEEAAGIVKYKFKKEAAQNKLEKTNNNLTRIKDILTELKGQYSRLKIQSQRANNFLNLSAKVKELEINLFVRKIDTIQNKISQQKRKSTKLEHEIDCILNENHGIEKELNLIQMRLNEKDKHIDNVQQKITQESNLLSEKRNKLKVLEEKKKFYIKDINRLKKDIIDTGNEYIDLQNERKNLENNIGCNKKELDVFKEKLANEKIELNKLSIAIQAKEDMIETSRGDVINLHNNIADKKSEIDSMKNFQENIIKRMEQIKNEISILSNCKETGNKFLKETIILASEQNDKIVKYNKLIADLKLKENENKKFLNDISENINKNKIQLQGKISNFNLLKNMEEAYEGYYRSVKNLMIACTKDKELGNKVRGIVAELLKVDEKYEKAIDITLGNNLQNIVTRNEEDAKYIINYLRRKNLGRITFLPLSTIKANPLCIKDGDRKRYHILGLASDLVSYDSMYVNIMEYLLGRTIIMEHLDDAISLSKHFDNRFRIVTLEGDVINPGGSLTGGSLPKSSGNLLNRKDKISNLKKEINNLSKLQKELEQERRDLNHTLEETRNKLELYDDKLQDANIEAVKLEKEEEKYQDELTRHKESIERYRGENEKLNLELANMESIRGELIQEMDKFVSKKNSYEEGMKKFMTEFREESDKVKKVEARVTDFKMQIKFLENELSSRKNKLKEVEGKLNNNLKVKDSKTAELSEIQARISNIKKEMLSNESEIKGISQSIIEKEKKLMSLKHKKEGLTEKYYNYQDRLKETNEIHNRLEKNKNELNIEDAKYGVQLESVTEKLMEGYQLEYTEALEISSANIDNIDKVSEEIKSLKSKIRKLGSVDINSIEEYKETSQRLDFMNNQYEDLVSAKDDLQKVILDMENKMEKQFLCNFNKIRENFNQVFAILFDGGTATLNLEDEKNILTCGIDIQAQPPGKKLQNLSLLSGGEKTLTAVALLFSIFQVKPAPFCILDEIDAALDESNINRYTSYLKSLSGETQFIMITHRKGTMEIADMLYGVTMEEEGVSKIVSVKLTDNLDELAS